MPHWFNNTVKIDGANYLTFWKDFGSNPVLLLLHYSAVRSKIPSKKTVGFSNLTIYFVSSYCEIALIPNECMLLVKVFAQAQFITTRIFCLLSIYDDQFRFLQSLHVTSL